LIGFCDFGVRFGRFLFGFVPFLRAFETGKIDVSAYAKMAVGARGRAEAEKLLEF